MPSSLAIGAIAPMATWVPDCFQMATSISLFWLGVLDLLAGFVLGELVDVAPPIPHVDVFVGRGDQQRHVFHKARLLGRALLLVLHGARSTHDR